MPMPVSSITRPSPSLSSGSSEVSDGYDADQEENLLMNHLGATTITTTIAATAASGASVGASSAEALDEDEQGASLSPSSPSPTAASAAVIWAQQSLRNRPKKYPSLMNLGGRKRPRRRKRRRHSQHHNKSSSSSFSKGSSSSSSRSSVSFCSCTSCCGSRSSSYYQGEENTIDGVSDDIDRSDLLQEHEEEVSTSLGGDPTASAGCLAGGGIVLYDSDGQEDDSHRTKIYQGNSCCRLHGQYPRRYQYNHHHHKRINRRHGNSSIPHVTHITTSSSNNNTSPFWCSEHVVPNPMKKKMIMGTILQEKEPVSSAAHNQNPFLQALVEFFHQIPSDLKTMHADAYNAMVIGAANNMLQQQQQQQQTNGLFNVVFDQPYTIAQALSFSPCPRYGGHQLSKLCYCDTLLIVNCVPC